MYFRRFIYRLVVITMYVNSGLIPWFLTMKMYGLSNNIWVYIVPRAISAYYVILLKTFMEPLPASLEESAELDGAGILTVFTRIIFPLSKPILATIAVFAAVTQWNSWFDNLILVTRADLKTLQLTLRDVLNRASALAKQMNQSGSGSSMEIASTMDITPTSVRMTMTMIVTLPILFVYPFMQRYFIKGIMLGAIKG
jgi:ABC-type glycerol-3-phosphate transport system permease component